MQNLVNYAISYAKHGFSVIPIINKKPIIKFANKPALTVEQIEKIWTLNPLADIALKTDKFFVIDVDRHGEVDGMKSIKALKHDEWFKNTLTEKTAHGGYHFYFQKSAEKEVQQNIGFLPGVDVKAHVNNYVVVAPSRGYKWLNHNLIRPAPTGLLDLLIEKQPKPIDIDLDSNAYTIKSNNVTTKLFEQIVDGLGETGGRNNALASFMGALLYRGVDPNKAYSLAIIANEHTKSKLSDEEVYRTCSSMVDKELRRRGINA